MQITKIVVTGGPCGGKSTALSWIQNAIPRLGYNVVFVPETATELISGGVAPWTCGSNIEFQQCQMRLQLEKEAIFERAALSMKTDKVLIVCDRGAIDNKAYMNDTEFAEVLSGIGRTEIELRDGYDAVFHLVTAAKGAPSHYSIANNTARTETPEQAAALDDIIVSAWAGHPHLRVIDNSTDFEGKMLRLLTEITSFLGEPEPREIERKFLIEYPDIAALESRPGCGKAEIVQTYLRANEGEERRVRRRGMNGSYVYYKTLKKKKTGAERVEIEERLTREEYEALLAQADPERVPIEKTRYCLVYEGQYFEIDVYPFWDDKAIAEIELTSAEQAIVFPPELKIIREVTDDDAYKNSSLARRQKAGR